MIVHVLLWKLAISRYKRYFQTSIEIAMFVFLFYLLYSLSITVTIKDENKNIINMEAYKYSALPSLKQVVYYPKNNWTENLMHLVGEKLELKPLDTIKGPGYYGTNDNSTITSFTDRINEDAAVISFENEPSGELPKNLKYTIRSIGAGNTDYMVKTIKADQTYLSHYKFGHVYERFMRLQWAVDSSFIQLRNNKSITQELSFKEFDTAESGISDLDIALYGHMLVNIFVLTLTFMFHVGRVVEDRISGVQALLTMSGVSSFTLNLSHFLNATSFGVIYSIIGVIFYTMKMSSGHAIVEHSSVFLVALMFLMHFASIIMLAFFTSFVLPNQKLVVASALGIYFLTMVPMFFLFYPSLANMPDILVFLCGLIPHQPLFWYLVHLLQAEATGRGLTFSTLLEKSEDLHMTPLFAYTMMFIQIMFYGGLAQYLALVKPGKYVTPMPWSFLCKKDFWTKKVTPDVEMAEVTQPLQQDSQYFEKGPPDSQIGIKIIDVSKAYKNQRVLSNLNLNVYKGEITVLLGHNGAGKTTILSIIAGMNRATSGKVLINGLDNITYRKKLFNAIGVCPQENMFFKDLSVLQHITFFTMLRKRVNFMKARQMAKDLLKQLGLSDKQNSGVTEISGGMMRRVQLGCALAGDADILILDEPTSGLDVETRRELWDLLLSIRGTRTVLLTTHFMEEADVLGDRVAALHNGQLRCHATPDYLKKAVGKGYLLNLVTLGLPKTEEISEAVTTNVPEASLQEATLNAVTFNLPPDTTTSFPRLFQTLEDNREALGIESIGVGTATLEEVFLTLCSDVDVKFTRDTIDAASQETSSDKLTGYKLILSQIKALFVRQMKLIVAKKYTFIFMQLLIPLCLLAICVATQNKVTPPESQTNATAMDLTLYKPLVYKKILMDIKDPTYTDMEKKVKTAYKDFDFEDVNDISNATLQASLESPVEYRKYILGLQLSNENAQVQYTTAVRHAAPVALNLLSNMLAGNDLSITTYNEPILTQKELEKILGTTARVKTKVDTLAISMAVGVVLAMWLASISASLPKERTTGTRHIFMMYGCSAQLYWIFTWLYHAVLCTLVFIIPALIIIVALEGESLTLDEGCYVGSLFLIMIVGALDVLALFYLCSMHHKEIGYAIVTCVLIAIFAWLLPFYFDFMRTDKINGWFYKLLVVVEHFFPVFTCTNTIVKAGSIAATNAMMKQNNCAAYRKNFEELRSCFERTPNSQCYLCFEGESAAKGILLLLFQAVLYMVLVLMTQMGVFKKLVDWIWNIGYRATATTSLDPGATDEITYVSNAMNLPQSKVTDAMLIHNVHKCYPSIFKKNTVAVKGVSLSIKKGECFGLVGVNGAGKTTMFSMIVGANQITRGAIVCNGLRATCTPGKYMHQLGFCPQHHSLDDFLTGEENLSLLLKLRGFQKKDIKREVDYWINIVALEKYRRRAMGAYSGGCKRRLAAAAAMMSGGELTLLDEPTAGVDVSARRALWMALKAGQRAGRALVVSSHSMEEIEALCGRVCVVVAGRVRALAAPADMRRRYARGHTLHVNVAQESVPSDQNVEHLKKDVQALFQCTLEDSNMCMLHYRITETMKYSDLFNAVEGLKSRYPQLIQDYTVKEPTLEQVFLSFAKQNKTEEKASGWGINLSTAASV